jgi:hypothetical protein
MPDNDKSLSDQPTFSGGRQPQDEGPQSLGDEHTFSGGVQNSPQSLGDEATFGDVAGVGEAAFDDGMEVVDLAARYTTEGVLGKRMLGDGAKSRTAVSRFLTEAKSIAALNHPNIVQIYDYGRAADGPFLIMEYVEGNSLLGRLRDGAIPLDEAIDMTCSQAPAGYRNVTLASGKKGIEPDPDTAPIVTKLFEWYTTGKYSLAEIADLATDSGLKFGRSRNLAATVHNLFKNPIYYGDFLFTGKMYRGIHTPLVTRELWDRVQEVRKDRGTRKPKRSKHSFAFSNLIQCRHCGCSLVAELKKQKYIYYHCTGYKGKCEEPYVREEVLEEQFGEVIRSLKFDPETLDWVTSALKESHQDEKRFHDEAIQRLQSEYSRLQNRIDQMYVDKLDRRVTDEFFDQKSAEWRQEQQGILHNLEQHQNANQSYLQEGVAILELANRAAELFEKQSASEKRRLLDFVLSNSSWGDGELTVEFRQPFDLIAVAAMELKQKKAAGVDSDDLHQFKYSPSDSK